MFIIPHEIYKVSPYAYKDHRYPAPSLPGRTKVNPQRQLDPHQSGDGTTGIYIHFTDTSIFLLYHKPPAIETQSSFPLSLYSSKNLLFTDKDGI